VVDAESRTHDHKNLFIVGSSVFPTVGSPNPTLTLAALALRAARDIAKQLGVSPKKSPQ
jgi:glucose dehydrogenase